MGGESEVTHDPLCPYQPSRIECNKDHDCDSGILIPESDVKCQCDLISKVRADELEQESARRAAKFGYWHDYRPELP